VVLSQILLRRSCRGRGPCLWRGVGGQRGAWGGRRAALVARRAPQRPWLEPGPEGGAGRLRLALAGRCRGRPPSAGARRRPARVWPLCSTAGSSRRPRPPAGRWRRGQASAPRGRSGTPPRWRGAWALGPPRAARRAAPGRALPGDAPDQRPPLTRRAWGPWAPRPLRALVSLPQEARLGLEGEPTTHGLE
jgi:hypothetical protein